MNPPAWEPKRPLAGEWIYEYYRDQFQTQQESRELDQPDPGDFGMFAPG